ncbi:MAG: VOC family protein [Candidatus Pacebacteria bacterium]|nr:VOC family protein [Candidatus Paceibacterota bacterium]MDR3582877.1 VOC family protein [Candidatus Paceibacterota bacterium]
MFQKITPFLWFDHEAEEAANFYVSVFAGRGEDAAIENVTYYNKESSQASGQAEGSAMTVAFRLAGQKFAAINGGPPFKLSEAVSFVINCETQEEVDYYWEKLSEGGDPKAQVCGWLKDEFGLSWQVTPTILPELLSDPNPEKARRVMSAMLSMKKIYIAELKQAAADK